MLRWQKLASLCRPDINTWRAGFWPVNHTRHVGHLCTTSTPEKNSNSYQKNKYRKFTIKYLWHTTCVCFQLKTWKLCHWHIFDNCMAFIAKLWNFGVIVTYLAALLTTYAVFVLFWWESSLIVACSLFGLIITWRVFFLCCIFMLLIIGAAVTNTS